MVKLAGQLSVSAYLKNFLLHYVIYLDIIFLMILCTRVPFYRDSQFLLTFNDRISIKFATKVTFRYFDLYFNIFHKATVFTLLLNKSFLLDNFCKTLSNILGVRPEELVEVAVERNV